MQFCVRHAFKQVRFQLRTSTDNEALPAFAAAVRMLPTAGHAAIGYLPAAGPTAANPQQQRAAAGWDRQTDRRPTDAQTMLSILCGQCQQLTNAGSSVTVPGMGKRARRLAYVHCNCMQMNVR